MNIIYIYIYIYISVSSKLSKTQYINGFTTSGFWKSFGLSPNGLVSKKSFYMGTLPKNSRKNDEAVLKTWTTNAVIYLNRNIVRNFFF